MVALSPTETEKEQPLAKGDRFSVLFKLNLAPTPPPGGVTRLGELVICLGRFGADIGHCEARFPLPAVVERPPPWSIQVSPVPPMVCGVGATIEYKLYNPSSQVHEIRVSMALSDAFVVAGATSSRIEILPESEHVMRFHMIPTKTGNLKLPQLAVHLESSFTGGAGGDEAHATALQGLAGLSLPGRRSVFVRPRQLDG